MRRIGAMGLILILAAAVGQVPAVPETAPDQGESNRLLIEKLRADPDRYARLQRDLKAFLALPADKQERLRQLDQDLHEQGPEDQERLWHVMDRYVTWLDRLSPRDRSQIESAPSNAARLSIIKGIVEQQWIDRLPRAKRDQLAAAPEEKRAGLIGKFKDEDKRRRREWEKVFDSVEGGPRKGPIVRADDLPDDVRRFVEKELLPALSPEDRDKLKDLEGKWPRYARTLIEMAEKYPVVSPPPSSGPITHYNELPEGIKRQIGLYFRDPKKLFSPDKKKVYEDMGKWPEYAIGVTEFMRSKNLPMSQELGPCRPREFSWEVREFIEDKLLPELNSDEHEKIDKVEGKWPEYPRVMFELTRKHNLSIPGLPLPGSRDFWDKLRMAVTEVSEHRLREFARELTKQEREGLQLPGFDPNQSRERLKQEFFKRYPAELFGGMGRKPKMGPPGLPGPPRDR